MWGVDDDFSKELKCENMSDFRRRLKQSFGTTAVEEMPEEEVVCMICCVEIKEKASLSRKCLRTPHPCGGAVCKCTIDVCYGCYVETLWKSPRSQKAFGRFRGACPGCRAEFCHYDIVYVELKKKKPPQKAEAPDKKHLTRLRISRVFSDLQETLTVENWTKRQLQGPDDGSVESIVRKFALDEGKELPLPGLSAEQRKVVHKIADDLGLGHESVGEGKDRKLVLTKLEDASVGDDVVFRGYLCLEGPCVDALADAFKNDVSEKCRSMRVARDGVAHHITILTKDELEELGKSRKQKGKELVSALLESLARFAKGDWRVLGLGSIEEEANQTWFVVVEWECVNRWRVEELKLKPAHFHITIGFVTKDIHNLPKDRSTLIRSK